MIEQRATTSRGYLVGVPLATLAALAVLWVVVAAKPLNGREASAINLHDISKNLEQHVLLAVVALAIALMVGFPLGVVLSRGLGFLRAIVFTLANLSQAIPSVSILVLFYLWVGSGPRTAIYALAAFSVLPILRNTVVGLLGVDPAVMEAAKGMGMSRLQSLRRVELPLAAPVIFAGVRTAVVLNISTATVATFIGGGGLGDTLGAGIDSRLGRVTLVGAVLVSCLAMLADWATGLLERRLSPRT